MNCENYCSWSSARAKPYNKPLFTDEGLFVFLLGLKRAGHILENDMFFDTLKVTTGPYICFFTLIYLQLVMDST